MSFWKKLFGVEKMSHADKAERKTNPPSAVLYSQPPDIHDAAEKGALAKVKAMLKDDPGLVSSKDKKEGLTPLHWAAYAGQKDVVELLLGNKADVNAVGSKGGQTPLLLAAAEGHKNVTELLLAKGASVDAADNLRMTPLHVAASAGFKDVVELLLAKGANLNVKNIDGNTPLELATRFGKNEVMELLRRPTSGKEISEADRKSIYSEFHRFLNTHAMIEAASRGLSEQAGIEYALTKASEHIERSYSMSFEQWTAIFKEGQSKKWDKWP